MRIRRAENKDEHAIRALCNKYKIEFPTKGIVLIAENENKEITAIGAIKTEVFIEPLISENSKAGYDILRMLEGIAIGNNEKSIRCITGKENEELFNKAGFYTIENDKLIMEKEL